MRLSPAEQALWYANITAAVFLLWRLYSQRLARIYPALFTYLVADSLEQIVALAFGRRRTVYAEIYFVGQALKVALAIWVVLELYQIALAQQPALARFGRRTLDYLFFFAVLAGLLNFVAEIGANPGRMNYPTRFTRLENTLDLVTLVVLVIITCFLLWFPVRASRNVALCLGGFVFYSFQRWAGLTLTTFWPQWTHELSIAMLSASFLCLAVWGIVLRREGEAVSVVTGHRWNPAKAERLTLQLDAINSRLVRLVARS
jgi:hypothetical protein